MQYVRLQLHVFDYFCDTPIVTIDETKLTEEIKKITGQVLKTLFEQRKVDEILKYYTEDCKFIFLSENQTVSGRQGE